MLGQRQAVQIAQYLEGNALFFKAGQADAITACFSEYSKQLLKRTKSAKAPIREQIKEAAAEAARQPAQKLERAKEAVHEDR